MYVNVQPTCCFRNICVSGNISLFMRTTLPRFLCVHAVRSWYNFNRSLCITTGTGIYRILRRKHFTAFRYNSRRFYRCTLFNFLYFTSLNTEQIFLRRVHSFNDPLSHKLLTILKPNFTYPLLCITLNEVSISSFNASVAFERSAFIELRSWSKLVKCEAKLKHFNWKMNLLNGQFELEWQIILFWKAFHEFSRTLFCSLFQDNISSRFCK